MPRPFSGRWWFLAAALALVAGATLTPSGPASPLVASVWCLTCSDHWLTDVLANVLLFVPLGYALTGTRETPRSDAWSAMRALRDTVVAAAVLSLAIETAQGLGMVAGRTPSVSDWVANVCGALLGAIGFVRRMTLRRPTVSAARVLTLSWTLALLAMWIGASWMLSPPSATVSSATESIAVSPMATTPSYGWLDATVDDVRVNDVPIAHRGTGPVIVRAAIRTDSLRVQVWVQGIDRRREIVPMLYVHPTDRETPLLLLGQRGHDVVVRSTRRGAHWGLDLPDAVLREVATPSNGIRELEAHVTRESLDIRDVTSSRRETLRLTPALGWTMIQSVARTEGPSMPWWTALWIALWFAPGSAWCTHAWRTRGAFVWCIGIFALLYGGTSTLRMPFLSIADLAVAIGATVVGAVIGRRPRDEANVASSPRREFSLSVPERRP